MVSLEERYGLHRVQDAVKVIPQNAQILIPQLPIKSSEVLIDVDYLQIDSASFKQLISEHGENEEKIKTAILSIVTTRGKMQNPVTGSGGMLLGRIKEMGSDFRVQHSHVTVGDAIATLISLTATPLVCEEILAIDFAKERVKIKGHAILFISSLFAKMPEDMSEGAALASFDICGAPSLALRHIVNGQTVLILGLGKSGRSVLSAIKQERPQCRVLAIDANTKNISDCEQNPFYKENSAFACVNAQDPFALQKWTLQNNENELADVVINLVNVPQTELSSLLACREGGVVLFFSMATHFQKAALGAESVAKDVTMIVGSGYCVGHAEKMLQLIRQDEYLKDYFEKNFGI